MHNRFSVSRLSLLFSITVPPHRNKKHYRQISYRACFISDEILSRPDYDDNNELDNKGRTAIGREIHSGNEWRRGQIIDVVVDRSESLVANASVVVVVV